MIFYFSGTGNSRYVAERIASITDDTLVSMNDKIKNHDYRKLDCTEKIVFVTPTYAWRIPRVVEDWIQRTEFSSDQVWFVMTCGSEIGNAAKYNKRFSEQKHFTYCGTAQIIMPENYIAMFDAPEWKEAERIIEAAEPNIQKTGELIKAGSCFSIPRNNLTDRIMSTVVNPVFYRFFVKTKAFYVKDNCISCGKCVTQCPLHNIRMKSGKPEWGRTCTHCMACICFCPQEAIEYGKKSIGQPRYQCPKINNSKSQ